MSEVNTYREFYAKQGLTRSMRYLVRNTAIRALSLNIGAKKPNNCIQFPYYHHVFDDERKGFERQLSYFKNYGDFISLEDACHMLTANTPIDGRFFCVTFDDGFRSTYTNMLEITDKLDIPVMIYLPTNYIGLDPKIPEDVGKIKQFHPEDPKLIPFLSWEDCKEMLNHNISFGSHTVDHANLSKISPQEIEIELKRSKQIIEQELKIDCKHFACPWGRSGIDFDPKITTQIAKNVGYQSFATTDRGIMRQGDTLYHIKRDHLLANWANYQLKYFFGL